MNKTGCVLLAEDEENDIFLLQRAFAQAEISNSLQVVRDGQEAIDYLSGAGKFEDRGQYELPCLLILDLKMPRKTGMDVLQWLRGHESLCCLPVMVFSSSAHPGDVKKAYQLGANAFVTKPSGTLQRTELAAMIKGFWLTFNETTSLSS